MPPRPAKEDVDGTWAYLESGVEKIQNHLHEGLDMDTYMNVYTAVHNFCTAQRGNGPQGTIHLGASAQRGAHLIGDDLYQRLRHYLRTHLEMVYAKGREHTQEALLTYYIKQWNRYTNAAKYVNHLFKYLNRHWVKREVDEGKKDVYDVYTLHLVMWKDEFFMKVHEDVMAAVLRMVEKQRTGETIEQSQIKSIVDSFVSLGLDDQDPTKTTLDIYKFYFAKPFLEATETFYRNESSQFLTDNPVVEFMKKADARLIEEKNRVPMYLHSDITTDLIKCTLKALVEEHAPTLRDEFQRLLNADKQEDLARMYGLLSRIPAGLDPLRTRFEEHVRKAGEGSVATAATQGEAMDPKAYVDSLLSVYVRYEKLVKDAFKGEAEFVRSLDNACKEFVNRNSVCKSNTTRSPELLAKYTDALLKRSGKDEEGDMEETQTRIMTIFRFIEDKDVFQKFYQKMLAKRLIHAASTSDEAEVSMIGKLKEVCGFEYTNKLQRMFQDMQTSKDLNREYSTWLSDNLDAEDQKGIIDAQFSVLGTSFWPLPPQTTNFTPPEEIIKTYERFQRYYDKKHTGRKLTWQWSLCKGEVKANYIKGAKVPYTFQVSTYQLAILTMFNDTTSVKYEDALAATSLSKDVFDPSISVMVKAKVLLTSPEGGKTEPGTVFKLNENFKYKKIKVNLNMAIKTEQKAEAEETHKTIEEDRKLLLQSAIVRIMKSRKKLRHVELVQETITQVKARFKPNIQDIKKAIDQLIDKEYLERLDDDNLGYLA